MTTIGSLHAVVNVYIANIKTVTLVVKMSAAGKLCFISLYAHPELTTWTLSGKELRKIVCWQKGSCVEKNYQQTLKL